MNSIQHLKTYVHLFEQQETNDDYEGKFKMVLWSVTTHFIIIKQVFARLQQNYFLFNTTNLKNQLK